MGRHRLASTRRRRPSLLAAVIIAPAAAFLATAGDVAPARPVVKAEPVAPAAVILDGPPCCLEVVATAMPAVAPEPMAGFAAGDRPAAAASRWRVVVPENRTPLPVGVAPEAGLQVRTILAARAISAAFPEILTIGGVRQDPLPWHPHGLAIDVMIPNASSPSGIALGNQIVSFALKNATRFALMDAIWRGVYYTPNGPQGHSNGHFDHVHITTLGGGYPTGAEKYLR